MNAKQKLHQVHLQEWAIRFADQKASGLTVRQWCEQNKLSFHTYNYWKHLLKEEVVDQSLPDIVPLSLPVFSGSDSSSGTTAPAFPSIRAIRSIRSNNSNVKMLINGVSIEIDTAISEEFLGKLIKAVCHNIYNTSICFLRKTLIFTSVSCFHMEKRDM